MPLRRQTLAGEGHVTSTPGASFHSMKAITVDKSKLRETLVKNREEHMALYDQAVVVFKRRLEEELSHRLEMVRAGDTSFALHIALPIPEQHMDDFDRAIEMCDWAMGDVMELEEEDVESYLQNRWGWARSFAANTGSYLAR